MRRRTSAARITASAVVLTMAVLLPATSAVAGPGSTVRVSVAGGVPAEYSSLPSISADGTVVVFAGSAHGAAPWVDGNHLYARDRSDGTTTLVDVSNVGTPSDTGNLSDFDVSADGRYVVFASDSAVFDPGREWGCTEYDEEDDEVRAPCREVYVRDLQAGTTELVSAAMSGSANGHSYAPAISADGRTVVFESAATNLVPTATSGDTDVYVRDLGADLTALVSVASSGAPDGRSGAPDISADGDSVAFWSNATNLAAFNPAPYADIFVRDLGTGSTESVMSVPMSSESFDPSISGDGSVVSFITQEALVPADLNGSWDMYVVDRTTGDLASPSAGSSAYGSDRGQLSDDGRFLVFRSGAGLLSGLTDGVSRVFVYDRASGVTTLESVRADGTEPNAGANTGFGSISGDGRFVAFESPADDIVPGDTPGSWDVFVHDRAAPSETASGAGSADTDIEADGATLLDPIETAVSDSPGAVTIEELGPDDPAPPVGAYTLLGQQVSITADPAEPGQWLTFRFVADASIVPAGLPVSDFTLVRDGVALTDCADGSDPGPCVASRTLRPDGDLAIVAHSPQASVWAVVGPAAEPGDSSPPVIDLRAPSDGAVFVKGTSVTVDFSCSDEGGSGLVSCTGDLSSGEPLDTSTVGSRSFSVTASDGAGNVATATATYRIVFDVSGFFAPVDDSPIVNRASAGKAIPVTFSLGGDQGMQIFEPGYPTSQPVACEGGAPTDAIEQTVSASQSGLTFDETTGRYTYLWKTQKAWSRPPGPCRDLILRFVDGGELRASFVFR